MLQKSFVTPPYALSLRINYSLVGKGPFILTAGIQFSNYKIGVYILLPHKRKIEIMYK